MTQLDLRSRVVRTLSKRDELSFSRLARTLRLTNVKRLDNTLQALRKDGLIHFTGPRRGWRLGNGPTYTPMRRLKWGK